MSGAIYCQFFSDRAGCVGGVVVTRGPRLPNTHCLYALLPISVLKRQFRRNMHCESPCVTFVITYIINLPNMSRLGVIVWSIFDFSDSEKTGKETMELHRQSEEQEQDTQGLLDDDKSYRPQPSELEADLRGQIRRYAIRFYTSLAVTTVLALVLLWSLTRVRVVVRDPLLDLYCLCFPAPSGCSPHTNFRTSSTEPPRRVRRCHLLRQHPPLLSVPDAA
jgi:hypothetical protein